MAIFLFRCFKFTVIKTHKIHFQYFIKNLWINFELYFASLLSLFIEILAYMIALNIHRNHKLIRIFYSS